MLAKVSSLIYLPVLVVLEMMGALPYDWEGLVNSSDVPQYQVTQKIVVHMHIHYIHDRRVSRRYPPIRIIYSYK